MRARLSRARSGTRSDGRPTSRSWARRRSWSEGLLRRKRPDGADLAAPVRVEAGEVGADRTLCVIKGAGAGNDPAVLQAVEEDDVAERPLLLLRNGLKRHVQLPRGGPLHEIAAVPQGAPDEPGAVEALQTRRPPDIREAEAAFDDLPGT